MSTYLVHHGIMGQHWGTQNGPPYPLSDTVKAIAYRGGYDKEGNKIYNPSAEDVKLARKEVDKHIKSMSDKDLQEYKNRLLLENSIGDITGSNWSEKRKRKFYENIDKAVSDGSTTAAKNIITNSELLAANKLLTTFLGDQEIANIITKLNIKDSDKS